MKMYLSSYKLGDNPQSLVGLVGNNKKAAIIPNALDFATDMDRKNATIQREIDGLKNLGFDPEVVDLRSYFGRPEDLDKKLSVFGMVWVNGGNTFILRRAFRQSGMDEWLMKRKDDKEFVYGGYSAGVCVLSPSLEGSDITDDPNVAPEGYQKEIIWEGLGLISFAFAPHFESPGHPETESVGREVEFYNKKGIEYKALHDGEVIIIDN